MGLFSFITDFFSKPKKGKPKKKKKVAKKTAAKGKVRKSSAAREDSDSLALKKKKAAAKKKKASAKETDADIKLGKKKKDPATKKRKKESSGFLPFKLDAKSAKTRKKSQKVSSDPIDEQSLGFSISLNNDNAQAKKREAMRISVNGLTAHVHQLKKQFDVVDISATGLGFKFDKPRMKGGVKLEMDLYLKGEVKASNILCKVMRHERGSVGCLFIDLDRSQDDTVHEIVLLGQKQQTERRNALKDLEFKMPD